MIRRIIEKVIDFDDVIDNQDNVSLDIDQFDRMHDEIILNDFYEAISHVNHEYQIMVPDNMATELFSCIKNAMNNLAENVKGCKKLTDSNKAWAESNKDHLAEIIFIQELDDEFAKTIVFKDWTDCTFDGNNERYVYDMIASASHGADGCVIIKNGRYSTDSLYSSSHLVTPRDIGEYLYKYIDHEYCAVDDFVNNDNALCIVVDTDDPLIRKYISCARLKMTLETYDRFISNKHVNEKFIELEDDSDESRENALDDIEAFSKDTSCEKLIEISSRLKYHFQESQSFNSKRFDKINIATDADSIPVLGDAIYEFLQRISMSPDTVFINNESPIPEIRKLWKTGEYYQVCFAKMRLDGPKYGPVQAFFNYMIVDSHKAESIRGQKFPFNANFRGYEFDYSSTRENNKTLYRMCPILYADKKIGYGVRNDKRTAKMSNIVKSRPILPKEFIENDMRSFDVYNVKNRYTNGDLDVICMLVKKSDFNVKIYMNMV